MAGRPSLSNLIHSQPQQSDGFGASTVDHGLGGSAPPPVSVSAPEAPVDASPSLQARSVAPGTFSAPPPPPPRPLQQLHHGSPISPVTPQGPTPSAVRPHHSGDAVATPSQRSHSSTTSLYQCADCQRRYSRPEHLARHIQTHTLGKRFACQVCGKAFARADLLKRHTANHQNDNDPTKKKRRTNLEPGAGRVSHACRPCAAARVKCEEAKPCTRCRTRNLNCEYSSSEAGSAAAMHLLHLSANAHSSHSSPAQSSPQGQSPVVKLSPSQSQTLFQPHSQQQPQYRRRMLHQNSTESPGLTQISTAKPEEAQLPTPDTVMEQGNDGQFPQGYDPNAGNVADMARLPFSDFLRDVLYEPAMDPTKLAEAQGLAVLDFCDDTNLELNDMDFGLLDHWNLDGMGASVTAQEFTPRTDDSSVDLSQMRRSLTKVWTDSPWRWIPRNVDNGYGEQSFLPVPTGDTTSPVFQESRRLLDRVVQDKLEPSGRDRILAIVLSTCRNNNMMTRVASSFPSIEVMDTLIHIFLAAHACSVSGWIHFGTFTLNAQWPEWLAVAGAAGAVITPVQTLRKFGLALQEAVRLSIPARFEENNTTIKDLGLLQSLILGQDIGLWSGNRRKMEIAECHLLIPITMMRYRSLFQRSTYPVIIVSPEDEGDVLEDKWRRWAVRESWKRLVFHSYLRDAQTSMTTLTNPSMSYSELTLPLPESREMWVAKTAQEWKVQYLARGAGQIKRPPSVGDLFRDISLLSNNRERLDTQFSISIFLHGFWSLILEYRQLSTVYRSRSPNTISGSQSVLLGERHQELWKDLQNFQYMISEWQEALSAQESLLLNLVIMNLSVSLDDLQLFSGKEGDEQARRIYPVLQQWAETAEARQALWHAGQILMHAKQFPQGHLKDFYAIAVHHAALALWTYGVVYKASNRPPMSASPYSNELIYLDAPQSSAVHRFFTIGQGCAVIRGPATSEGASEALVERPRACMEVVQDILRANFTAAQHFLPPIVENLCHLIKQLGNAAWAVGLG